jgi:RecA/RadA recombinase
MNLYDISTKLVFQKGWSVIPTDPKTKKPLIPWKTYQERYPLLEELEGWFLDKTPEMVSLAVVTGKLSNIAVLDSDNGTEYPLGLDSELKSKTGRGYHLFYTFHEGVRNTVKIKGQEFDIRGEGGYAIIPPSIHPSGVKYQWVKRGEPGEFPQELIQENDSQRFDWKSAFDTSSGSRNNTLYKGACSLFAKGFQREEVMQFMKAMNATFKPPIGEDELQKTLESASRHEQKKEVPKIATPRKISSLTDEWLEMRKEEEMAPSTGFPSLDNIINGFIPRHLYTLTAETNSGKTQLAINFAVALAKQKKKVAFIALEPDINIITGIKACIADTSYKNAPIDVTSDYIDIFLQKDIPTYEVLEATMTELAKEYALIIVDHIGYFATGENTVSVQADLLKKLATLSKTAQSAFLIIAHPKKRQGSGKLTMNDISGSAAFKQDSTEVLLLNRERLNPEDEYDETMAPTAFLVVAKKKVTNNSKATYVRIGFSDKSVRIIDLDCTDNSKKVEKYI